MKVISYEIFNLIRKLPNKVLLISLFWVAYGVFYHKYHILKSYYEYKIKGEKESKRKVIFKISCRL